MNYHIIDVHNKYNNYLRITKMINQETAGQWIIRLEYQYG